MILPYPSIILDLLQNATTNDLASSVVNLLKGAGLLGNLAEIAEKKRTQDEHLLTDKLEMVKGMLFRVCNRSKQGLQVFSHIFNRTFEAP